MSATALMDALLDRSIVAGYTGAGYRIRERTRGWKQLPAIPGKVVLVTGATSGIGQATAEGFAELGAAVRILARDADRGEHIRAGILARTGNDDVRVYLGDLSEMRSVRRFAEKFLAGESRLDVLVNNAGLLTRERSVSAEGIELTFATNVLGPFLLTGLLAPRLGSDGSGRVINVSSGGMYAQRLSVEDLQSEEQSFDGTRAYARAKRAQVVLSEMWAERLEGAGVAVHAMHPGWVDTPGLKSSLPGFYDATRRLLRTPREGADTILWLGAASEPEARTGGFWHDRRERPTHRVPWTKESREDRERLWSECEQLSGLREKPASTSPNRRSR